MAPPAAPPEVSEKSSFFAFAFIIAFFFFFSSSFSFFSLSYSSARFSTQPQNFVFDKKGVITTINKVIKESAAFIIISVRVITSSFFSPQKYVFPPFPPNKSLCFTAYLAFFVFLVLRDALFSLSVFRPARRKGGLREISAIVRSSGVATCGCRRRLLLYKRSRGWP